MRRGFEHWPLTRSARARLIQPRHWQVSWRSGHRREPQRQPCGVLSPRSEPWKTSNGCHQQSRPCTRGSQREPHRRAFSPICLQQAWSTWSRGPKTHDTGPCLALWRSLAGCASYAWARPPASECVTWLWRALSSFGIPKQGTRGTPPDRSAGTRTGSVRGFIATWSHWAGRQTCWSGNWERRAWKHAWPRPWRAQCTPTPGGMRYAEAGPQRPGPANPTSPTTNGGGGGRARPWRCSTPPSGPTQGSSPLLSCLHGLATEGL